MKNPCRKFWPPICSECFLNMLCDMFFVFGRNCCAQIKLLSLTVVITRVVAQANCFLKMEILPRELTVICDRVSWQLGRDYISLFILNGHIALAQGSTIVHLVRGRHFRHNGVMKNTLLLFMRRENWRQRIVDGYKFDVKCFRRACK